MNVLFEYLYRDAGNFKNFGEVIFSNTNHFKVEVLEREIAESMFDGKFFVAEGLEIPTLYFQNYDKDLDHDWHEFGAMSMSADDVTDSKGRDIQEILKSLKRHSKI
jgi:hypothetical protein